MKRVVYQGTAVRNFIVSPKETSKHDGTSDEDSKAPSIEDVSLIANEYDSCYAIEKPLYNTLSSDLKFLSFAFEKNTNSSYDTIMLQDIIVEYKNYQNYADCYKYSGNEYHFKYLSEYVSIGIPTNVYNRLISMATQSIKCPINRNTSIEHEGYTWLIAHMCLKPTVQCLTYSKQTDDLKSFGELNRCMENLKSNAVGVGSFNIAIVESTIDLKLFLMFTLKMFQLTEKTQKKSTQDTPLKVEPPKDVLDMLNFGKVYNPRTF